MSIKDVIVAFSICTAFALTVFYGPPLIEYGTIFPSQIKEAKIERAIKAKEEIKKKETELRKKQRLYYKLLDLADKDGHDLNFDEFEDLCKRLGYGERLNELLESKSIEYSRFGAGFEVGGVRPLSRIYLHSYETMLNSQFPSPTISQLEKAIRSYENDKH